MRILVVDDEERLALSVARGLELEGFDVDVCLNGTDGLWRATEIPYAAIVLDIMLPGLNGYEVCRRLRADGIGTPVLMLTAKEGDYDEAEALELGVSGVPCLVLDGVIPIPGAQDLAFYRHLVDKGLRVEQEQQGG